MVVFGKTLINFFYNLLFKSRKIKTLFIFLLLPFTIFSQKFYKNLENKFNIIYDQGEIGDLLSESYRNNDNANLRISYIDKAYNLTKVNKDSTLLPYIYFHYADTYLESSNYGKSIKYLNKIEDIVGWDDFNFLLSRVYAFKAEINKKNKDYNKAVENNLIVINKSKYEYLQIIAKYSITGIFIETKKCEIAKVYIKEIFDYFKKMNYDENNQRNQILAFAYIKTSTCEKEYVTKLEFINKGIELMSKWLPVNILQTYVARADLYLNHNKVILAINDYNTSLKIAKKNGLKHHIIDNYLNIAKSYIKLNDFYKTITYIDSASINIKIDDLNFKIIKDSLSYTAYKNIKNYKKAFIFAEKIIKHQDSLLNHNKDSLYIAYGKKYQTDQKVQENEILKKENVIKNLEVEKEKTNRNYSIALSFSILLILFFAWYKFKEKQKTASKLEAQNIIINQQKIELEKANKNKQKLFSIVAHDLVNPFNAILGYTRLLNDDYESFEDKERKEFINIIDKYATNNYDLTKTLLDWAKTQQKGIIVKKENLNCKAIVNTAIKPFLILADKKQIQVNLHILENTTVEADNNMMQTVIGNLFVNAVKFTPQKGEINLNLTKLENGTIQLEIADNGIGMSQEQLNNLFDISKVNTRKGTENEKGNGLGLVLCKELMTMQNGTLNFFSTLNAGSKAVITV